MSLLQRLCLYLKHRILDCAHPLPRRIEVFPGPPGTIERAIVEAVMARVGIVELRAWHKGDERPTVWVDDSEVGVSGCFAVCRYLGRLWRFHPTTPESALMVDGSLELLAQFLQPLGKVDVANHVCAFATELELRLEAHDGDAPWLEGFEKETVADVCWHAAFTYIFRDHHVDLDHPRLMEWFDAMEGDEDVLDDEAKDD